MRSRLPLLPLAGLYRAAYRLHHLVYLQPGRPLNNARLIVVGSYLAGGAGKTPFTAWLAEFISANAGKNPMRDNGACNTDAPDACAQDANNTGAGNAVAGETSAADATAGETGACKPRIAILCHSKARDEAEMLRQKFAGMPQVRVYTTGNRYKTAHELDKDFDYIICDDGFEDSRLAGAITFRLDWGNPPASLGDLLPAGNCRSLPADHGEPAHALACGKDVRFEIANVINSEGVSASALADASHKPVAICGIGNTTRFVHDLETFGIHPEYTIRRPDHDIHFSQAIVKALSRQSPVIITEKDAARLPRDMRKNPGIYVAYQRVTVSEGATDTILHVIRA